MRIVLAAVFLFCAGCAGYVTPGGPAPLSDISRADATLLLAQQPSPRFPVKLGMVRVQASAYKSFSSASYGSGRFSVVATHELLSDQPLQTVSKWPLVADVAPLNTTLLPSRLESLDDLRLAAAKNQADVLMVYTIDTSFQVKGHRYAPLADLPVGKAPDKDAAITSAASAAFIDVRTGFSYGTVQAAASVDDLSDAWQTGKTLDDKRMQAERDAFGSMLSAAEKTWSDIASRYEDAQAPDVSLSAAR